MTASAVELRDRVAALPGADRLLPALRGLPPSFLVGGAVRDLLRGATGIDLDLAVEGDALAAARELAARLGGEAMVHDRFGTATVRAGDLSVDLARTRRERYPRPGALPEVEPAPLRDDLGRRDFTINAMAVSLAQDDLGRLHDPFGGQRDLDRAALRVLHDRSFVDDPTRLLRAVRYEARLGVAIEPTTEALARQAVAGGALATVSGPRLAQELLRLLAEADAAAAARRVHELALDRALDPALVADPDAVAGAALAASETGADRGLAALAALVAVDPERLAGWLNTLGLDRSRRERVERAARRGPALAGELRREDSRAVVHALLRHEPPEALALALASGAPAERVLDYVTRTRDMELEITGSDLLAAGVPESPAVGRALAGTLRRKLDGEVSGRDEELRVALDLARDERW